MCQLIPNLVPLLNQQRCFTGTGYASNSSNSATPSRGNAVSTAHAHQSQHRSASGFATPQTMPQAQQIAAPTSNAEYEALRNQAHEAYRAGDFHRALQLCQSVRTCAPNANAQFCAPAALVPPSTKLPCYTAGFL